MPFHSRIANSDESNEDCFSSTPLEAEPLVAVLAHNKIAFAASPEKQ